MSLQLIRILVVLMIANQAIGTGYGSWKSGYNKELFWRGVKKIFLLFIGYGAIALAVHFAADYIPKAEYFTKVCDSLKQLLNEPANAALPVKTPNPENMKHH